MDTRKSEQHAAAFTTLNPNAKVPVIVDGEVVVFDSNAVLLCLAEKTGQFLPAPQDHGPMLSWLNACRSACGDSSTATEPRNACALISFQNICRVIGPPRPLVRPQEDRRG